MISDQDAETQSFARRMTALTIVKTVNFILLVGWTTIGVVLTYDSMQMRSFGDTGETFVQAFLIPIGVVILVSLPQVVLLAISTRAKKLVCNFPTYVIFLTAAITISILSALVLYLTIGLGGFI